MSELEVVDTCTLETCNGMKDAAPSAYSNSKCLISRQSN